MENKKDIGKAFREKLDGLQKSPKDAVWDAIYADLHEKKRRRFLPFWFTTSMITIIGILILGIFTYPLWENYAPKIYMEMPKGDDSDSDANATGTNKTNNDSQSGDLRSTDGQENNQSTGAADAGVKPGGSETENGSRSPGNGSTQATGTVISRTNNNDLNTERQTSNSDTPLYRRSFVTAGRNTGNYTPAKVQGGQNDVVAGSGATANRNDTGTSSNTGSNPSSSTRAATSTTTSKRGSSTTASGSTATGNEAEGGNSRTGKNSSTAGKTTVNREDDTEDDLDDTLADNLLELEEEMDADMEDSLVDEKPVSPYRKPVLDDNPKSNKITEEDLKSFYVYAFAGPTYFRDPEASYIDPTLSNSKSSAQQSLSYGLYIGYNLNPKWSFRAGIMKSGTEFHTENAMLNDIAGSPANYRGIDYLYGLSNEIVLSGLGQPDGNGDMVANFNIVHNAEYLEIPIEATYRIYAEKFDIGLIGGVTTRYLKENSLYAENAHGRIRLGGAKEMEKLTFGTTLGFGFYYEVLPSLQINAEPVFKYYFNSPDNMKPYTFGIQAGLQYNFNFSKK